MSGSDVMFENDTILFNGSLESYLVIAVIFIIVPALNLLPMNSVPVATTTVVTNCL